MPSGIEGEIRKHLHEISRRSGVPFKVVMEVLKRIMIIFNPLERMISRRS